MAKKPINIFEALNPVGTSKLLNNAASFVGSIPGNFKSVYDALGFQGLQQSLDGLSTGFQSVANNITKAGPTGEQLWQLEQQNTANQRTVEDLKNAGLNPALMYGNSGSQVSSPQLSSGAGMSLSDMIELATLPQKIRGLELDNQAKAIDVDWSEREHAANYDNIITQVAGSQLDNKAKTITNSYLIRMQEAELRVKEKTAEQLESSSKELDKRIELMSVQELDTFIHAIDTAQHIRYLASMERLNEAQIRELDAMVKKLNEDTRLLKLNADNFDDITVIGSTSSNVKFGPVGTGESRPMTLADKKRFAEELRDKKIRDKDKDWKDIKKEYPE